MSTTASYNTAASHSDTDGRLRSPFRLASGDRFEPYKHDYRARLRSNSASFGSGRGSGRDSPLRNMEKSTAMLRRMNDRNRMQGEGASAASIAKQDSLSDMTAAFFGIALSSFSSTGQSASAPLPFPSQQAADPGGLIPPPTRPPCPHHDNPKSDSHAYKRQGPVLRQEPPALATATSRPIARLLLPPGLPALATAISRPIALGLQLGPPALATAFLRPITLRLQLGPPALATAISRPIALPPGRPALATAHSVALPLRLGPPALGTLRASLPVNHRVMPTIAHTESFRMESSAARSILALIVSAERNAGLAPARNRLERIDY
ncbi:hypothetical protein K438DRAFT_1759815 [Mycena galopus ATCC 62051]|nr:hypothetical protein K438DRAFT_1759815 [Mycena galopus ATCC 62051]